jgi:hypothetical protein
LIQTTAVAIDPLTSARRAVRVVSNSSRIRRFHLHDFAQRRGHIRTAGRHPRRDLRAWAGGPIKAGANARKFSHLIEPDYRSEWSQTGENSSDRGLEELRAQ